MKLLGWTSLLTDAATEAIYPLLPIVVTRVLGGTNMSLGLIEGAAEAIAGVLKIVSGASPIAPAGAGHWSSRATRWQGLRGR